MRVSAIQANSATLMPTTMEMMGGGNLTVEEMRRLIGTGALDVQGYVLLGALVVVIAALVTAAVVLYWQQKIAVSRVQQGQVSVRAMFPTPGGPPPVTRIFGADIPDFGKLSAEPERTDRLTSSK